MSSTIPIPEVEAATTPLAAALAGAGSEPELTLDRGVRTPLGFAGRAEELAALLHGAGVFDLGCRSFLHATGKDRVRWLNGMITQTVKGMSPGQALYTLILNAQGRIQGDGEVFFQDEALLLETDRSQVERLLGHLRRFIIMDDVQLQELDVSRTVMGIAGPRAAAMLEALGGAIPEADTFRETELAGVPVTLVHGYGPVAPRFAIHVAAERVLAVWQALVAAGAVACGTAALEDLRVLEGVPRFGVDFSDQHLPQETGLLRALNFTKGCYLGQEIVERIRSRATVHRALRQFELQGSLPQAGAGEKIALHSGDAAAGELTSVARFDLPDFARTLGLGMVRVAAVEKSASGEEAIRYDGGTAVALEALPYPARS